MDNTTNSDLHSQYQDILDRYDTNSMETRPKALNTSPLMIDTPHKSSSNLSKYLFFFSLVAFIIVTGTIAYTLFNQSYSIVSKVLPTSAITTTEATKEYSNKAYGYSFQYSDKYTLAEENESVAVINSDARVIILGANSISLNLTDYLVETDEIAKTAYEGQPSTEVRDTKDVIIDGLSCVQREEYVIAGDLTQIKTYCQNGSTFVSLTLLPTQEKILNEKFYSEILSTFKFTN